MGWYQKGSVDSTSAKGIQSLLAEPPERGRATLQDQRRWANWFAVSKAWNRHGAWGRNRIPRPPACLLDGPIRIGRRKGVRGQFMDKKWKCGRFMDSAGDSWKDGRTSAPAVGLLRK